MSKPDLRIRVIPTITDIAADEWDACADPCAAGASADRFIPPASGRSVRGHGNGGAAPSSGGLAESAATVAPEAESISQEEAFNPFISHDFLAALEASGSAVARTGCQPQHLVAETEAGAVLGVAPCYMKNHSRGEYVFDHAWADAYERAGGDYYPKLQVSVPFTPV